MKALRALAMTVLVGACASEIAAQTRGTLPSRLAWGTVNFLFIPHTSARLELWLSPTQLGIASGAPKWEQVAFFDPAAVLTWVASARVVIATNEIADDDTATILSTPQLHSTQAEPTGNTRGHDGAPPGAVALVPLALHEPCGSG